MRETRRGNNGADLGNIYSNGPGEGRCHIHHANGKGKSSGIRNGCLGVALRRRVGNLASADIATCLGRGRGCGGSDNGTHSKLTWAGYAG